MNEMDLWCYKCKRNLPSYNFYYKKTGQPITPCKDCKVSIGANYYENNKDKFSLEKRHLINEVTLPLKQRGCIDCSKVFIPEAMEFDHIKGTKQYSISTLCYLPVSDDEMIRLLHQELALCEICCANCHRKRTISRYKNSARRDYIDQKFSSKNLNEKSLYSYELLVTNGCLDCGTKDLLVLEFDHVKDVKVTSISQMIIRPRYFLSDVMEEINKCEIRCVICHRVKTFLRIDGFEETKQVKTRNSGASFCDCGGPKDPKAIKCSACHNATKFDASKYPPLEEIIVGVETYGWLPYAKTLNVSDRGLRKVALKLGADPLPRRKR